MAEKELEKDVQGVHCVPGQQGLKVLKVTRPGGEDADTLAKGVDCGSDEELGDGWEDGNDHQGQEEVLALVESSQHGRCSFDLMFHRN